MFQPQVKLEFVRRYVNPANGWRVFVDIDPSEEGRTGGARRSEDSEAQRLRMIESAEMVRRELRTLDVTVGGNRRKWCGQHKVPFTEGDRDIVAFHSARKLHVIAEVEGTSSGQPEQKLYKAIGQIVMAASCVPLGDWHRLLILAVHGDQMSRHLARTDALDKLGIAAVSIASEQHQDRWFFGASLLERTSDR